MIKQSLLNSIAFKLMQKIYGLEAMYFCNKRKHGDWECFIMLPYTGEKPVVVTGKTSHEAHVALTDALEKMNVC